MNLSRIVFSCVSVLCLGALVQADSDTAVPDAARLPWIETSIQALHRNGVAAQVWREHGVARLDGTSEVPIKHVVDCRTAGACGDVADWAARSGFRPARVRGEFGHGGVALHAIELRHGLPLEAGRIQAEALRVHRALIRFSGARYRTWMLDVEPDRAGDAR